MKKNNKKATILTYEPKEFIFREGESGNSAYIIESGSVEVLKSGARGQVKLAEIGAGQTVGEMGLFLSQRVHTATIRTLEKTTVKKLDSETFNKLLEQCPDDIVQIVHSLVDRIYKSNEKIVKIEQASVLLDSKINEIIIKPKSKEVKEQMEKCEIPVAQLPFKIGGHKTGDMPNSYDHNHIYISSPETPLLVSRNHCSIEISKNENGEKGVFFIDRGSRFGSIVNDIKIGRGKGVYKLPLKEGKNKVILGPKNAGYELEIDCK